jgi:hypothetical protein
MVSKEVYKVCNSFFDMMGHSDQVYVSNQVYFYDWSFLYFFLCLIRNMTTYLERQILFKHFYFHELFEC